MKIETYAHPILSCKDAKQLEKRLLADEAGEWAVMKRAGDAIARGLAADYTELRPFPERLRVLALVGKGHNGGDALLACGKLLAEYPRAQVDLILASASEALKPLTARALEGLEGRVRQHLFLSGSVEEATLLLKTIAAGQSFHICIDGLLGMDFQAPLRSPISSLIEAVNQFKKIDLRASVDLPTGLGDDPSELKFQADFSYATGIVKRPLFEGIADGGRVRYLDLGFFKVDSVDTFETPEFVLREAVLQPLNRLRPALSDKRQFGHLFVIGGSAYMPGALLMAVKAAVRSGVGLITAFVPESVAASLAAQVPEAMWIPWPETTNGTLSPRALPLLMDRIGRASAVLVGPGMGNDRNTELLAQEIVAKADCPVIADADALRSRVIEVGAKRKSGFGEFVITPHMGEFMRVAKIPEPDSSSETLLGFSSVYKVITVLKGSNTRICDGESILFNTTGGPVLSRGGSGDLLAGLIGGMVAQNNENVLLAVARGCMLHGLAAQYLARAKGQVVVRTTQLLDYLPEVLRSLGGDADR